MTRRDAKVGRKVPAGGLCPGCRFVTVVRSDKGSTFYLCRLAKTDARFRKYPPQPVLACAGHAS